MVEKVFLIKLNRLFISNKNKEYICALLTYCLLFHFFIKTPHVTLFQQG